MNHEDAMMEKALPVVEAITGRRFNSADRGEANALDYIAIALLSVRKETLKEVKEKVSVRSCCREIVAKAIRKLEEKWTINP